MFDVFFFLLREKGLDVSPHEWLTLLSALEKGLARSGVTGFYRLCRAILLKSEGDYDKFDDAFLEYFKALRVNREIPPELLLWLSADGDAPNLPQEGVAPDPKTLWADFEELLNKQDGAHHGGHHWIGTDGTSPFGNRGSGMGGIRLEGESLNQNAFTVAGERRYRDFREDRSLDPRSFQIALQSLRRLSSRNASAKTELRLNASIQETADAGGILRLVFDRPRKNTVKLLLLMDSGGSMEPYSDLLAALFKAAGRSDHWGDLRVYYFHNCIRNHLYRTPRILPAESIPADWLLQNLDAGYRLLIVGDALMDMAELTGGPAPTGMDRLRGLKAHFPRIAWMTPQRTKPQTFNRWGDSYYRIAEEIPMFPLTTAGIADAVKGLTATR